MIKFKIAIIVFSVLVISLYISTILLLIVAKKHEMWDDKSLTQHHRQAILVDKGQ